VLACVVAAPRSAAAIAMEPTHVLALDRGQFLSLIRARPEFALHIMATLANRIRKMNASL
jgi:CRP-like cAMP-binding protein